MNGVVNTASQKPRKPTKNEKRRQRKKVEKEGALEAVDAQVAIGINHNEEKEEEDEGPLNIEVEYVVPDASSLVETSGMDDAVAAEFKQIFERFSKSGLEKEDEPTVEEAAPAAGKKDSTKESEKEEDGDKEDDEEGGEKGGNKLSKKQRKLKSRLTVAELKQLVQRPDVVEAHDVTAADPRLLVHLKAYRNTVPVPRHWCHKRKYLQGKRGIEKKAFELPEFIAMTGISKLRDTADEAEAGKRAKQRSRDRVQPKMGKIDIDYQVLHDAFFKWQTKPLLNGVGDLYYEGKEFEVRLKEKKPGFLSEELKSALGMPENAPPPWLINMQRYGPPPAYPHLRIPGLTAPIPPKASFGYHAGGWGKPPVDESGNPLYGDVFGTLGVEEERAKIDRSHWGEIDEVESEDEEEEEEDADGDATAGTQTPMDGAESTMSGLETPESTLDLRKRGIETPSEAGTPAPRELYTVVGEERASVGGALFGAEKRYALAPPLPPTPSDVAVSINPDELETQLQDTEVLRERYEETLQAQQPEVDDLSDLLAEENRKRKRKLEKQKGGGKKTKEFKF